MDKSSVKVGDKYRHADKEIEVVSVRTMVRSRLVIKGFKGSYTGEPEPMDDFVEWAKGGGWKKVEPA